MARKQRHNADLILLLSRGIPVAEAARQAGLSTRTVFRRLGNSDFQKQVRETRAKAMEQSAGALAHLTQKAAVTLESLLSDESPSIRLSAARGVFEFAQRLRESVDLEMRIAALETLQEISE